MRSFWRGVVALLRELADEGAYQRHLKLHCLEHSPKEWRRFSDARLNTKYQQAKCC